MRTYFLLLLLYIPIVGLAQVESDFCGFQTPENEYRTNKNPHYWKNRPPYEGYWQQDVHYKIKADIDETKDIITGELILTYWNNSPHDLDEVYFHLYQNAFQPNSYADELSKVNKVKNTFGKYEKENKGTEIKWITIENRGEDLALKPEIDNTIMHIRLPETLRSGEKTVFKIAFKTYFDTGSMRRRFKKFASSGYTHYDGVHWYPRISVFDHQHAWDTYQHLGKEFYGDFGTYDVQLSFSSNYVVEATGQLINEDEVLPSELKEKLNIQKFAGKPWNSKASIVTPYKRSERKTWQYHAENVHDFAFTADPNYRIGEATWNGIRIISLVQEPHAAGWLNAAQYTAEVVKVYSRDFGMYIYPKIIVADAQDGMEYPMITLDGGSDPDYRSLLAHEVGHNWFFGMVGNNETYRALLDEGFTQFLTAWSMEKIDATVKVNKSQSSYVNYYKKEQYPMENNVLRGYMNDAIKADDPPIDIHSDYFNSALGHGGGYRHVYMKTAAMLYNLQYVLGDKLFLEAMQHYFNQWKVCHPYDDDFKRSIIDYTGTDLSWFFDQWITTTKHIDYKIKSIKKSSYGTYNITIERKGTMQMPLDIQVITKHNDVKNYYIPNTTFTKEVSEKTKVLPKWEAWDKLFTTYTFSVNIAEGIKDVIIDPSYRLADVHPFDNHKKADYDLDFDSKIYNPSSIYRYQAKWRPDVWYNDLDGVKVGMHVNGNYMNYKRKLHATIWYNTRLVAGSVDKTFADKIWNTLHDKWSFNLSYETPLKPWHNTLIQLDGRILDGLHLARVGLKHKLRETDEIELYAKYMIRNNTNDLQYLMHPYLWNSNMRNTYIQGSYTHNYRLVNSNGKLTLAMRMPFWFSQYNENRISLEITNVRNVGKSQLKTRTFAYGSKGNNAAPESAIYAWGANPEEMMENKFTRSQAFFSPKNHNLGYTTNHWQYGGGLNLRGYNNYTLVDSNSYMGLVQVWRSPVAISENVELELDRMFRFKPKWFKNVKCIPYLFADAALLTYNNSDNELILARPRFDAGWGLAFTLRKFGVLETVKPFTIRVDFPWLLNSPPYAEPDYFSTKRWLIGINRAF